MAAVCSRLLRVQRGEDVAWIYDQVSAPSAPVEVSQRLAAEMGGERLVTALFLDPAVVRKALLVSLGLPL